MARERAATVTGGDEVRADVAERGQPLTVADGGEPSDPSPRDILEQHALDRVLGAELEDLVEAGRTRGQRAV